MANYKILFLILILISASNLTSVENDPGTGFAFYPFAGYSSETNIMFGSYALYTYRPANIPANYEPSKLELNVIYTLNNQLRLLLRNKLLLADGKYNIGLPLRYYKWPTTFYGLYMQEEPELEEKFDLQAWEIYPFLEVMLGQHNSLTTTWYAKGFQILKEDDECGLLCDQITGFTDYFISCIELKLQRKTIDNVNFPTKGYDLSISDQVYDNSLASDFDFNVLEIDLRIYQALNGQQTIAAQLFFKKVTGDVPFYELADLGSWLRGYDSHKYISNNLTFARIENRVFPWSDTIFQSYGFVLFCEAGETFKHGDDLNYENLKLSYGFGLRYTLLPKEKLNLRLDIGFSKDGMEIDIISFEAF
ncbi:MAG: outer membrane protein assembly factor [Candidatus Cloacimonetes bacterium]|nr:outer membrane protein assembly factor [Candidatus Cloacimonadota bacterium]